MRIQQPGLVDLCCGGGGFSWGFQQAGWAILLGVDRCRHSVATFQKNLRTKFLCTDLLATDALDQITAALGMRHPAAVIAGPPCQGFSRAGRRKLHNPRNDVVLACARIAAALGSELIVIENVRNITTARYQTFLGQTVRILRRNGYRVDYRFLNALHFAVPQDRVRLVIVGCRHRPRQQICSVLDTLCSQTCRAVSVSEAWVGVPEDPGLADPALLPNHIPMAHSEKVRRKIARIAPGEGPFSYRKLHPDRPAATLVCGHRALPCHYKADRTITAREAARLQGFPDNFVFEGPVGTQMLQVANAVPPPLAKAIGNAVRELIL